MSPVTSSQFENQTPGQALCDAFQEKLLNNSKMRALLDYLFLDPSGVLGTSFIGDLLNFLNPIGTVVYSPKALDPSAANPANGAIWLEANNQRLSQVEYPRLFAFYGLAYKQVGDNDATDFRVPDLTDKFILGRSATAAYGTTGGEKSHILTTEELAPHHHEIKKLFTVGLDRNSNKNGLTNNPDLGDAQPFSFNTEDTGGDGVTKDADGNFIATAHNNMPPYFVCVGYVLAGYKVNGVMV